MGRELKVSKNIRKADTSKRDFIINAIALIVFPLILVLTWIVGYILLGE